MTLREELAERLNQAWCSWQSDGGRQTPHVPLSSGEWGQPYVNNCLAVADECIRQMRWSWLVGELQGTDATMSCGYSRERVLSGHQEHNEYTHIAKKGDFEARHGADIHLAPEDWKP